MTRTEIEAVLQKHQVHHTGRCGECINQNLDCWEGIVSGLLALSPTPSREGLSAIFKKHSYQYASGKEWVAAVKKDLMAWAAGTPPTPPPSREGLEAILRAKIVPHEAMSPQLVDALMAWAAGTPLAPRRCKTCGQVPRVQRGEGEHG